MALKKEEIKAVIQQDATLKGKYFGEHDGEACVIGGLALAAGFDKADFDKLLNSISLRTMTTHKMLQMIESKFGLNHGQMLTLQNINDSTENLELRRKWLCEKVDSWEE